MKIILRKLKKHDLNKIMEFYPEKELLQNLGINKKPQEISRKEELERMLKSIKDYLNKKPEKYQLAIEVNGEFAGTIGSNKIDYENRSVLIGYWLGKRYRGKGIMVIALKEFLKEMKKKVNPIRFEAHVFTFNQSSSKVLEKCGFKCEGIKRKAQKINGKFYDDKIYAKLK